MNLLPFSAPARALAWLTMATAAFLFTGCETVRQPERVHSSTGTRMGKIRKTAALPQISLYQLSAGGVREKRDDWTDQAQRSAEEVFAGSTRYVLLEDLEGNPELAAEAAEVRALLRAIDMNLMVFAGATPLQIPNAAQRFEYSVGDISSLLDSAGADALLLIDGEDDYFTGDRKALVALSFVAAAFTGVHVMPSSGASRMTAALIARDGTVLWHGWLSHGTIADLRQPRGVQDTLGRLLVTMPRWSDSAAP